MPKKRRPKKRKHSQKPGRTPPTSKGGASHLQSAQLQPLLEEALQFQQVGQFGRAEQLYHAILAKDPDHLGALSCYGTLLYIGKQFEPAAKMVSRAVRLAPRDPALHANLGAIQYELEKYDDSKRALKKAIRLQDDFPGAWYNLGRAHTALGQHEEAVSCYRKAITQDSQDAEAWNNLGNALQRLGEFDDAIEAFHRAVGINPTYAIVYANMANSLIYLGNSELARQMSQKALDIQPDCAKAYHCLGNAYVLLDDFDNAFKNFNAYLRQAPRDRVAHESMIQLLIDHHQWAAAADALNKALPFAEEGTKLKTFLIHCKTQICDWNGLDPLIEEVKEAVQVSGDAVSPFIYLCLDTTSADRRKATEHYANSLLKDFSAEYRPPPSQPMAVGERPLRVGFASNDYRGHVVATIIADLIEGLDRARFTSFAYSFGKDDGSAIGTRARQAFDHFVDIRDLSYEESANRIREDQIDILIDLKGYTTGFRFPIFTSHPAPLQVRWLGHPGTMAADCYEYLITDPFAVPLESAEHFSEHLVHLPDAYQVCVRYQDLTPLSRVDCGLPENGVVCCSFNSPYKITPEVWSAWMDILTESPDTVLWLLEWNPKVPENLRREAEARGVSADRLIFAPYAGHVTHLSRYPLADLFLDTSIVSACATSGDALWGGCPVITCVGDTYASRAAGSMLRAVGMEELITHSLDEYKSLASGLIQDPERLQALRKRLEAGRDTAALFDIKRFACHFQSALEHMWQRHMAGRAPCSFRIEPGGKAQDYDTSRHSTS